MWGPNQSRFLGVKGWTGTFEVTLKEEGNGIFAGFPAAYALNQTVKGSVRADRWDQSIGGWLGSLDGTGNIDNKATIPFGQCTMTITQKGSGSINMQKYIGKPSVAFLTLDLGASDTYSFWFASTPIEVEQVTTVACPEGTTSIPLKLDVQWDPTGRAEELVFPESGFNLKGQKKMMGPPSAAARMDGSEYDVSWDFRPLDVKELELIIEPQGYDTWRPEATKSESEPGNKIGIKAWLQWKDGSPLGTDTRAQSIAFDLVRVSHEPGVALNFPIQDAQSTADLQFREPENPKFRITGDEKQHAETLPGAAPTEATAVVSSFDWGGWAEIQASATMPGGQVIKGHMRGESARTSVPLPKRAGSSKIADVWKEQKGINKPDNDDSEPNPIGLPGCDGDGLTLYEEYRGFYENGNHIEGNPQKKDFFILNLVGSDAEPGIWLFTDITDLEVHKDLTQQEFLFQERLVNKNHDQGPHRVDQHGVFLVTGDRQNGAEARFTEFGVRGRPYLTTGILVQPRSDPSKLLGKQKNLSGVDFMEIYDKAIAHELLHTIGVEHHGEGDTVLSVQLIFPDDPANTRGRPYFRGDSGTEVRIVDERTGQDICPAYYAAAKAALEKAEANLKLASTMEPDAAKFVQEGMEFLKVFVLNPAYQFAVKNGQHSGNEQCVMRYHFADVYQSQTSSDLYYFVPRGTEPSGLQLCESGDGTGVNAAREPQPRYFDAVAGRGRCKFWVCVNDAIPPGRL